MDANQTPNILAFENISKSFFGTQALNKINLAFQAGEVHALVGENGAGKSTLMKVLSGVHQPTAGRILIQGQAIQLKTPFDAQSQGISIIYQEFSLIKNFDVTDNVFLNREPNRGLGFYNKKEAKGKVQALLLDLGLELDVDRKVENLTVIQQQVVEIVKALSVTANVIIMDEPSAALSDVELKKLFDIIARLKRKGVTIIYISHMLEEVFEIADRVTVLKDGMLMGTHPIAELNKNQLVSMMVGRNIEQFFPKLVPPQSKILLEVIQLAKGEELQNINFSLHAGEILGISGLPGSGCLPLISCLFGLEPKDSGTILIDGAVKEIKSVPDAIKNRMGYLHEDRKNAGILAGLSIRDNTTIAHLKHYSKRGLLDSNLENQDTWDQIKRLKTKVAGICQNIAELSGGNQQKVLISRWLLKDPKIFIFAEPTRGIDIGAKTEIYKILRELTAKGCGILLLSSELPEVLGMADRILVMRKGKIEKILDQHKKKSTEEEVMSYAVGHRYEIN